MHRKKNFTVEKINPVSLYVAKLERFSEACLDFELLMFHIHVIACNSNVILY